jgi:hypothetical protein
VGKIVVDWLLNLPVVWMAVVVFLATYLFAAGIYWVVISLAVNDRARSFKAMAAVFMISTSTVVIYTGIAPRWIALLGYTLAVFYCSAATTSPGAFSFCRFGSF